MAEASRDEAVNLFPRVVAVHEKTVQAVARGEIRPESEPRPFRGRTVRCTTYRDTRVVPAIMAAALRLAEGDTSRIQITDEHEVIVLNNKRR